MTTTKTVPVAEALFTQTADGPRLLGSKCASCATPYFPRSAVCHNPECDAPAMADVNFGPTGKIWSCAVQNYQPPAPVVTEEPYAPYAMGMVDLDDGLRVMGRIDVDDPMSAQVGDEVELVVGRLGGDADGNDVVTWMFRLV